MRENFTFQDKSSLVYCWIDQITSSMLQNRNFLLTYPAEVSKQGIVFFIYPYWAFSTNKRNSQQHGSFAVTVNYQGHKWLTCGDLKVVGLALQGGYMKYPCYLCLWDSLLDDQHYERQKWLLRQRLKSDLHNIQSPPLVEPNKTMLPPLHIKLGVIKNFVQAIDKEGSRFSFLQESSYNYLKKLKAGIFDGPQIRELMKDPILDKALSEAVMSTWQSLKSVVTNFLRRKLKSYWRVSTNPDTNVSQTALSAVTLGVFSKGLWKFVWRAG